MCLPVRFSDVRIQMPAPSPHALLICASRHPAETDASATVPTPTQLAYRGHHATNSCTHLSATCFECTAPRITMDRTAWRCLPSDCHAQRPGMPAADPPRESTSLCEYWDLPVCRKLIQLPGRYNSATAVDRRGCCSPRLLRIISSERKPTL